MGLIKATGTFTGTSVNLPGLTGVNTSEIRWGQPATPGGELSGYDFVEYEMEANLGGREIPIGEFTHHNHPIFLSGQSQFWVYLTIKVYFENGDFYHDINVRLRHDETPNQGSHPNDVVKWEVIHEPEKVYIDGNEYDVEITGFRKPGEKQSKPNFDVPEGAKDTAYLYARFQRAAPQAS
ncbi:choice-of-anchor K domain-containing protein [Streptomyces sp. SudanB182_2057]|uniref:choice-of-anchor K domain-containing protein n=1 Tax=Streptomyces sp. SudanB182_2057 TaxID=3035281 RepID=UPI003F5736BF